MDGTKIFTAFCGARRIAGDLVEWVAEHGQTDLLIFEDGTGKQVDFDFRLEEPIRVGPGRPKLGVTAREVTLLPRHWEWLQEQPNGASAALRRLVDEARSRPENRERMAREATGRFLTAMAGNYAGYEEVTRALYAGDRERMVALMDGWPDDVRDYAVRLAG